MGRGGRDPPRGTFPGPPAAPASVGPGGGGGGDRIGDGVGGPGWTAGRARKRCRHPPPPHPGHLRKPRRAAPDHPQTSATSAGDRCAHAFALELNARGNRVVAAAVPAPRGRATRPAEDAPAAGPERRRTRGRTVSEKRRFLSRRGAPHVFRAARGHRERPAVRQDRGFCLPIPSMAALAPLGTSPPVRLARTRGEAAGV